MMINSSDMCKLAFALSHPVAGLRMSNTIANPASPSFALRSGLWVAQALVGLPFIAIGLSKMLMPIAKLSAVIPWTGQLPELFVRSIGVIDLAGGLGMLLPALTRIKPGPTVAAALGCTVLQTLAIGFHISRGEAAITPLNFLFLALSVFVLWVRGRKAPTPARSR
jgi:uncharacterized membrane protein YphA (DoxX/SURF4 family)